MKAILSYAISVMGATIGDTHSGDVMVYEFPNIGNE